MCDCEGANGSRDTLSDEVTPVSLDRALEKHIKALTASLSASDIPDAREAYERHIEWILEQLPADDYTAAWESAAALEEAVGKIVEALVALGLPDPARTLRDWRLLRDMGTLIYYVNEMARKVVLREMQVTPEIHGRLVDADRRLRELEVRILSDCPYLLDERAEAPTPALCLNRPRSTRKNLADCLLDCRFLLGKSRIMSLHLGHHYRNAQERVKQT